MATVASVILLLGVLVIQISAMEILEFNNATDITAESDYANDIATIEQGRLLTSIIAARCRNSLNGVSSVLPALKVSLTRLSNNHLYYFSPATPVAMHVTFDQARIFCSDHGMHLVTINSAVENTVVYTNVLKMRYTGVAGATGAWIGYRDTSGTGIYTWVQPGVGTTPTFFLGAKGIGQCAFYSNAVVAPPAATSWLTSACSGVANLRPFICEMEPPCSQVL